MAGLILLLSLLFGLSHSEEESIDYFHTGVFQAKRNSGLYQVKIGIDENDALIAAYGHFDSDK